MSRRVGLARFALGAALLLGAELPAQPTFWTLAIQDDPPLDLAPLPANIAPRDSVFVTRAALSPAARARLAAGLGFEHTTAADATAVGAAILGRSRPGRIPGDPRLRIERDGVAITALDLGATVAESIAAAAAEPLPAAILVGAHADARPPEGWSRGGEAEARPVVWIRQMHLQVSRMEGSCRRVTFMDQAPGDGESRAQLRRFYAQMGKRQGPFPQHLQGIAVDPTGAIYWSWTDRIVKTDTEGVVQATAEVPGHQGDLTWHDGRVVVAVNHGEFNDPEANHDSWAWVFDDASLEVIGKHRLPEVRYGAGGVCRAGDRYFVVGGLPVGLEGANDAANEVHEYDAEFRWIGTHRLPGGWTRLGIQTAEFAYGRFFFGCYGEPPCVLVASPDLRDVDRLDGARGAYGIAKAPAGMLLIGWDRAGEGGHGGGVTVMPPSALWR